MSEVFWKVYPEYMLYGMTFDEFWYGDPLLAEAYRTKHRLSIEQRNQELWLQGLYFYDAIAVALSNALSKHKQKYIAEPIRIFPPTEEEKKREVEETRRKMIAKLDAFKTAFEQSQSQRTE